MPYRNIVSFRVGDQMFADLGALAAARDTDVGKLLRALVRRELIGGLDRSAEQREQVLFLAIAMDGLLGAHPDAALRDVVVSLWRERLAGEASTHVA